MMIKSMSRIQPGVDIKVWFFPLQFIFCMIVYIHHNKGRDFMADISSPSSITIGELSRIVKEFEEKFKDGTEDPDRFLTLAEIEELWGKLIGDTNVLYSDMIQKLIYSINEKDVVRKKKRIQRKGNHTKE